MRPGEIIDELGYPSDTQHWVTDPHSERTTSHLWRVAANTDGVVVCGSYTFSTSPIGEFNLPPRPAVHVVTADTLDAARAIRRKLWNLGNAPFLIVILPHQVRVYRGFDFDQEKDGEDPFVTSNHELISSALKDFRASEIDSGRIWHSQSANVTPERRVDRRLLSNLTDLSDVLVRRWGLERATVHALIGKYIYLYYLRDRRILSDAWLEARGISAYDVMGAGASAANLEALTQALEDRFNGRIFPFDVAKLGPDRDDITATVASIFRGDTAHGQLALDFKIYDFSCIPVELLSSIYEQFLRAEGEAEDQGAVYTREFLADYLLSELSSVNAPKSGMKILDPACGSGVFLVLAYRRLIEFELRRTGQSRLAPEELARILVDSIYGVEPIREACYITEFSLILVLLSYIEPPELHQNEQFRFPDLHGSNILEGSFFSDDLLIWDQHISFDWVVGNPPWVSLNTTAKRNKQIDAWRWMSDNTNSVERPVGNRSVCEAFTWRATDALKVDGCAALLIHATSLFNTFSIPYRREFFAKHTVHRITNFANLAYVLFARPGNGAEKGRNQAQLPGANAPAASIIFSRASADRTVGQIVHFAPFAINQTLDRSTDPPPAKKPAWFITVFEDEVRIIDPSESAPEDSLTWKLALWGTHRDQLAIRRLRRALPLTIADFEGSRGWLLHEGAQLRERYNPAKEQVDPESLRRRRTRHLPILAQVKRLDVRAMKKELYLSVPDEDPVLQPIPASEHHVRLHGGTRGMEVAWAPHIFWSHKYAAYGRTDFVIPPRRIGLASPHADAEQLRAICLYLNSSVARYLLFFHSSTWGVDRSRLSPSDCRRLPLPSLSPDQVKALAGLHLRLSHEFEEPSFRLGPQDEHGTVELLRREIDDQVERLLEIPDYVSTICREFWEFRYKCNKGKLPAHAVQPAKTADLLEYASCLRDSLDAFAGTSHKISVRKGSQFTVCVVEITRATEPIQPIVDWGKDESPERDEVLWDMLRHQFSQWVYIQRGLRVFEGRIYRIWKSSRLIDWTKTQALLDSDDLIAEVLSLEGAPSDYR
ncbi:MAG TPA: N-6 DNA methylase [Armatimonadota bacterium]|nr:N-6 DNA methylase [Armatimonadota bacterium]